MLISANTETMLSLFPFICSIFKCYSSIMRQEKLPLIIESYFGLDLGVPSYACSHKLSALLFRWDGGRAAFSLGICLFLNLFVFVAFFSLNYRRHRCWESIAVPLPFFKILQGKPDLCFALLGILRAPYKHRKVRWVICPAQSSPSPVLYCLPA